MKYFRFPIRDFKFYYNRWVNKIAVWICILLAISSIIWLTNVYGSDTLNMVLIPIIMVIWASAVYPFDNALSNFLYPISNIPDIGEHFKGETF